MAGFTVAEKDVGGVIALLKGLGHQWFTTSVCRC